MKKIMTIFLSVLLAACHHNTAQSNMASNQYSPNKSRVYVYRINSRLGASQKDVVYVDDQKIGKIKNGTYLRAALTPGKHTIKIYDRHGMSTRAVEHKIVVRPGQTNYVKVQWSPNGDRKKTGRKGHTTWLPKYGPKFVNVGSVTGKSEVSRLQQAKG